MHTYPTTITQEWNSHSTLPHEHTHANLSRSRTNVRAANSTREKKRHSMIVSPESRNRQSYDDIETHSCINPHESTETYNTRTSDARQRLWQRLLVKGLKGDESAKGFWVRARLPSHTVRPSIGPINEASRVQPPRRARLVGGGMRSRPWNGCVTYGPEPLITGGRPAKDTARKKSTCGRSTV